MKLRILAYGIYMVLSLLISLTVSFIPPLLLFFALLQNLDPFLNSVGWPFENLRQYSIDIGSDAFDPFFFEYFWFILLLVPIILLCFSIYLVLLAGTFKLSRRGIPYLKNGTYLPETEEWLLYEFYEAYYYIFQHFIGFLSVFLERKVVHRFFGAKIGKGTVIGNAIVLTPDRTVIGENCLVGMGANICAHIYEDRALYVNTLKIGNNVTIGGHSLVFAGADIGDNVIVGANTVVPRDRVIPPNTIWVHGKCIPRKDLEWDEEEERAMEGRINNDN